MKKSLLIAFGAALLAAPSAMAQTDIWSEANPQFEPAKAYYARGWAQIESPVPVITNADGNTTIEFSFPTATFERWQNQNFISTGIAINAEDSYTLEMDITSSAAFNCGIKLANWNGTSDEGQLAFAENFALTEGTAHYTQDFKGTAVANFLILFDFGSNPENTTVKVENIKLIKTTKAENPGVVTADKTWYGSTDGKTIKDAAVSIDYAVTSNADGSFTVFWTINNKDKVEGMVAEVNIADEWYSGDKVQASTNPDYAHMSTSKAIYEDGDQVNCFFWTPYAGGVERWDFSYVFASENEMPNPTPLISATASDITDTTASINWTVTLPAALEGAEVKVVMNETEYTESPILLTDLTKDTAYEYTLKAVATLEGTDYESEEVKVSFTTLDPEAKDKAYEGVIEGIVLPNCWIDGVNTEDSREDVATDVNYKFVYTAQKVLECHISFTNENVTKIVGMASPEIWISDSAVYPGYFQPNPANAMAYSHIWNSTASQFAAGQDLTFRIRFVYNGGAAETPNQNYTVATEQSSSSAVEGIEATEAPVEYYNLQGMKVGNPAAGQIVIVRQGNKARKVIM